MRKSLSSSKVLIVGLTRNCEDVIEREVLKINSAFSEAKSINWLVIESDSDDGTLTKLKNLSKNDNFEFITLGKLQNQYPMLVERLSKCRNVYLEKLRTDTKYNDIDYVVVADLDGVNSELTATAVKSCWQLTEEWDACFANQSRAYYDIWALRHKLWSPNDCWQTYNFLRNNSMNQLSALEAAAYSRTININRNAPPIKVDSAFGGLGIYKKDTILSSTYIGLNENKEEICEHVSLHTAMCEKGLRLYIVPSLINCRGAKNRFTVTAKVIMIIKYPIKNLIRMFIRLIVFPKNI